MTQLSKNFNDEDLEKIKLRAILINLYVKNKGTLNGSIFRIQEFKDLIPSATLLYKPGSLNVAYIASVIKKKNEEARLASLFEMDPETLEVIISPGRNAKSDGLKMILGVYELIKDNPKYNIDIHNGTYIPAPSRGGRSAQNSSQNSQNTQNSGGSNSMVNGNTVSDMNNYKIHYQLPPNLYHYAISIGYTQYDIQPAMLKAFALLVYRYKMYFNVSLENAIYSYECTKFCENVNVNMITNILNNSLVNDSNDNDGFCWWERYQNVFMFHRIGVG